MSDSYPREVTPGTFFTRAEQVTLSAEQAAATAPLLARNDLRRVLVVVPPADAFLRIGSTDSYPLYAGVPNEFEGARCPTNALYVTELSEGDALTIWES